MKYSVITPSSDVIGASGLTITVSFTILNSFALNNQIWLLFPYWNPLSTSPQHMLSTTTPTCKGTQSMNSNLPCVYNTLTRILVITSAVSAPLSSGTTMTFTVNSFQNSYNGIPKSGFQINTIESTGIGLIDQSQVLSIMVSTFASLLQPTLVRADTVTTVDELSSLTFGFTLPLPVDSNCRIRIIFPSNQPVTNDLVTSVGTNLFSSAYGLSALNVAQQYAEVAGCPTYAESTTASQPSTVTLSKILNMGWVSNSNPFEFQMYAVYNGVEYNIAQVTSSTMIVTSSMLTRGQVASLAVYAFDDQGTSKQSRYQISVQPLHAIPSMNKIIVAFSTSGGDPIVLAGQTIGGCSVQVFGGAVSTQAQCMIDSTLNEIVLINAFGPTGTFPKGGSTLTYMVNTFGTNPTKTCGSVQYIVSTFATISGVDYPIDYFLFDSSIQRAPTFVPFIPQAPLLIVTVLNPSSQIASFKPTSYNFTITPKYVIPQGSLLVFTMPPTIILPLGVYQIFCAATLLNQNYYEFAQPTSLEPLSFQLRVLFATAQFPSDGVQSFTVRCDGIWNPRTLIPTASFTIQTTDQSICAIESASSGLTVTMLQLPSFNQVLITNDNFVNGQSSTISVELAPAILFYNSDILYLTFPQELTLPQSPACIGGNLLATLSCTSTSSQLEVHFSFKVPQLADQYMITFTVLNVINPPSTKRSSPFNQIYATDSSGNQISVYSQVGPTIVNLYPSQATGVLAQGDIALGAQTVYTITYTTMNAMAAGATFLVFYPQTVSIVPILSVCKITFSGQDYPMTCVVDNVSFTIRMLNGLTVSIPLGSSLTFTFSPVTNPTTPQSISSFRLITFTDNIQNYMVDVVSDNLVPQYLCQYPCATCPSYALRSHCLSCFTTEVQKYLSGTQCVAVCPKGLQPNQQYVCVGPTINFQTVLLSVSSYQASFQPAKYAIQILPQDLIPDATLIQITFPVEVTLADTASSIVCQTYAQRTSTQAFNNTGKVTMISGTPPLVISIDGIFQSKAQFDIGSKVTIFCDQLKNPSALTASGSFSVTLSNPIAPSSTMTTGMQVMLYAASNITFTMTALNRTTGVIGEYLLTFQSNTNLNSGSSFQMQFPSSLALPTAVTCSISSPLLLSVACSQGATCIQGPTNYISIPNGLITALFTYVSPPVPAMQPVSFIVSGVGNPPSTQPVQIAGVTLIDETGKVIPEPTNPIPAFSMKQAAEMQTRSLTLDSYQLGDNTGFQITYLTMNKMNPDSYIVVGYPLSANFSSGYDIACAVLVNGVPFAHTCKIDRIRREITFFVASPLGTPPKQASIPAGSTIQLLVKYFMNIAPPTSTDTFTLRSYADKARQFQIDQISLGLTLFSCYASYYFDSTTGLCTSCDQSCLTCSGSSTMCTSCSGLLGLSYLYQGQCYTPLMSCPIN